MSQTNLDRKLKHLFDGTDWNVYDDLILNLGVGAPGPDLLENCCDIFQEATKHRLNYEKENLSYLFQYGPTSGPVEVRNAISEYFSTQYIDNPVKSEDLIITTGASQGLHFVLSTLVDLNGIVFVDEVTYMIALDAIKQFTTITIIPLRLNNDGVSVKEFEQILQKKRFQSNSKTFWAMYYTIPAYHNPTGILFSEAICQNLAELAQKYDFLILCDDVYNILNYTIARPPKRLFAYDKGSGNIISNGSFSKIIGPGLRMGWLEVPARLKPILEMSGILNSGGCFNNYTSGILASLFELKLAQVHIDKVSHAYKERMLATCEVLERHLPPSCNWTRPSGGYFIWISLPPLADAAKFLQYCVKDEKVFFIPGSRFAYEPTVAKNCLRLSIAFHSKEKLADGALRFCASLKRFLEEELK
ncbi:PREDICTED: 2-aminoadipate transaminase isoform X1 [Rhagoletis zephyria]|uniref:2-aminoadipate transaminase isoform X1 n=1 Tax=Rhagoletis zephyria TaxID=28612 RepID=UPI0008115343|nr:PREDICTED: 2-aminoadipate transaminase isoform X1 [Rhagoletis zephyria]